MREILLMKPEDVDDPVQLRLRQEAILKGFPAYILHPLIEKDTYDRIATCR